MNDEKAITYKSITVGKLNGFVIVSESNGVTTSALGSYSNLKIAFEDILKFHFLTPKRQNELTEFQKIAEKANWDYQSTRKAVMRWELAEDGSDSGSEKN